MECQECQNSNRKNRGLTLTCVTLDSNKGVLIPRPEPQIITDLRNEPVCTFCIERKSQKILGIFDWEPFIVYGFFYFLFYKKESKKNLTNRRFVSA